MNYGFDTQYTNAYGNYPTIDQKSDVYVENGISPYFNVFTFFSIFLTFGNIILHLTIQFIGKSYNKIPIISYFVLYYYSFRMFIHIAKIKAGLKMYILNFKI